MLEFVRDAISLSGLTGTRLKSEVIGQYYPFWWGITSGGKSKNYGYSTAIIELNAATGEVHIKDSEETILGSAGHALELKVKKSSDTENLKIVLIEENLECYARLKNVIKSRWPNVSLSESEGSPELNKSNVYLLNTDLDTALETTEKISFGNAIYFFDPLRTVEWKTIDKVANNRVRSFYQKGTEFLIFLFTSDWFLGREEFPPLPKDFKESTWKQETKNVVLEADALFGNKKWRKYVLNSKSIKIRETTFIELYKKRLCEWFRYVLPLPFKPKTDQLFHLILCSNYET